MKLCHAAALALAGWCLIAPPVVVSKQPYALPHAPLWRWTNLGAFDSAEKCQYEREKDVDLASKGKDASEIAGAIWESSQWMICVSTDDPRLSEQPSLYTKMQNFFARNPLFGN